ncbi:hypothetical protein [Pseudactinotalea suaedae]|uniref:hypothetical protein n=1 Tax=Pseudactinotalea suaedae TaxID=1524924 RepID=UPI0012E1762E|nr:hypothetical protein [Pseudactinotalea suaedae]
MIALTVLMAGTMVAMATRPAAADPGDAASGAPAVSETWDWVLGQLATGTPVTSTSTVEPDQAYPPAWTGPVSGSVTLSGLPTPPALQDLQIEALVVTDRAYSIAVAPVEADGAFTFPWSHPGTKVFRLVDQATGDVLAEHAPSHGLVRSYDVPEGHHLHGRAFSYDQALTLVTALSLGELAVADRLAAGLLSLQTDGGPQDGGFVTSAAALYPEGAVPEYRTGNHALATYALLRYLRDGSPDAAARAQALDGAERGLDWLLARQAVDGPLAGLVRGGYGWYANGGFDPSYQLPWASTEHNVDAWHTLRLAEEVLGHAGAAGAVPVLHDAILERLWSSEEGRFWQGRSPDGPDPGHALDVSSWGAIFLQAAGHQAQAAQAMANIGWYASTHAGASGFAPVPFPAEPIVWVEGTAGVALAQLRLGQDPAPTLAALAPAATDGVYPGATRDDEWLSMTSAPAVGGATWVLLVRQAIAGLPSIWDLSDDEGRA